LELELELELDHHALPGARALRVGYMAWHAEQQDNSSGSHDDSIS